MALSLYGLISSAERDFIINGVNDNMRTDGRTINDFRVIEVNFNEFSDLVSRYLDGNKLY